MEQSPFERKRRHLLAEMNVVPYIDVMLVLVVIFIITAPLLASSIKLDLPKSDAAKAADMPKSITVVVDASGGLPVLATFA